MHRDRHIRGFALQRGIRQSGVARRQTVRAQAGELEMHKILANPTPVFEEFGDRRADVGCSGVESEIVVDALPERCDLLLVPHNWVLRYGEP